MTSVRQIEANRRNAALSTGPITEEGKKRSRRNAIRHGLAAETVIDPLEDSAEYAAFELAITADYEPQSAVERELVLRLASLLWRLRRATAMESRLFKHQGQCQTQPRPTSESTQKTETIVATLAAEGTESRGTNLLDECNRLCLVLKDGGGCDRAEDITQSFVQLSNLPTFPLDRLSRYEGRLWRQAGQIVIILEALQGRRSWKRATFGPKY